MLCVFQAALRASNTTMVRCLVNRKAGALSAQTVCKHDEVADLFVNSPAKQFWLARCATHIIIAWSNNRDFLFRSKHAPLFSQRRIARGLLRTYKIVINYLFHLWVNRGQMVENLNAQIIARRLLVLPLGSHFVYPSLKFLIFYGVPAFHN